MVRWKLSTPQLERISRTLKVRNKVRNRSEDIQVMCLLECSRCKERGAFLLDSPPLQAREVLRTGSPLVQERS